MRCSIPIGKRVPVNPFCFFFFYHAYFFLRIAGVAQAIMLWHMLLFGDAFGPAYAIFWCFCIQLCSFWGGSNYKKCFQQAITLLYGRFRRSQQCCFVFNACVYSSMYACMQSIHSLCAYSSTLCVHTAVLSVCIQQCNALLMFYV